MADAGEVLNRVRGFVLDMDGTTYLGGSLLPGASELVSFLRERDLPFLFLTNNSSQRGHQYAAKMQTLGLDVFAPDILTSGEATAMYLARHHSQERVFLVGTDALAEEFAAHNLHLVQEAPDLVVLGFDTTLTYGKLWTLCDYVRAGLPYVATHPDINCPIEGGFMPDIGATIRFVEASAGRLPDVIVGKPHAPIVAALSARMELPNESMCMVGDRLYTDIAMGSEGMRTVLLLTGETRREDLARAAQKPDVVVRDLMELVGILTKLEA